MRLPDIRNLFSDRKEQAAADVLNDAGYLAVPTSFRQWGIHNDKELERSPYFLWWEYLKKNKDYQAICETPKLQRGSKLYKDFGNIHLYDDFVVWWDEDERGSRLFGGGRTENLMPLQSPPSKKDMADENYIYIRVPMYLGKRHLISSFRHILDFYHTGKRGKKTAPPKALYELGKNFKVEKLIDYLTVYEMYNETDMTYWEVAHSVGLSATYKDKYGSDLEAAKDYLGLLGFQHFKKASILIDNVGKGRFPDFRDTRNDSI